MFICCRACDHVATPNSLASLIRGSAGDFLLQVLVNPLVPQPSKQSAEERYQQLHTSCSSTIAAWVTRAAASDSFVQLQPAMTAIETAMEASVAAGQHLRNDTSNGGKLMEETVLQVCCSTLWCGYLLTLKSSSLHSSQHLLLLASEHGCWFTKICFSVIGCIVTSYCKDQHTYSTCSSAMHACIQQPISGACCFFVPENISSC